MEGHPFHAHCRPRAPGRYTGKKDPEAEPALTFTECLLHARIAISTAYAISYGILTTALDKELRLREDKEYVPGRSAQDVSEPGIKPRLSRVASFQPGYKKNITTWIHTSFIIVIF